MLKKTFATLISIAFASSLFCAAYPFQSGVIANAAEKIGGMTVTATGEGITFGGTIAGNGQADIVRLKSFEYYGEKTLYHDEDVVPVKESTVQLGQPITVSVNRFTADGYDKIYDKFGIVQNGEIVASFSYATNVPSEITTVRRAQPSIKGLQVQNADDAFKLGVNHAAINCPISEFVYENKPISGGIEFTCNGGKYYFRKDRVEEFDAQLKSLSDNGVEVTVILIIPGGTRARSAASMIHPKAEPSENITAQQNATVLAPNLTNERGMAYWEAACEFLAQRYTLSEEHGFLSNIVVGNEVDIGGIWNNMGENPIDDYVAQYVRTLRATNTAFKKYNGNTNVLMSLTHAWNSYGVNIPAQYGTKLYMGKDIVDKVHALAKDEGDFNWGVAYHPYPSDLRDPRFWAVSEAICNDMFTTPQITYKNIDVLCRYFGQEAFLYGENMRPIYFTEQGLNSYSEADMAAFPSEYGAYTAEKGQKLQAFAYAYSYYLIARQPAIRGYMLHRHVDAVNETVPTLSLGLWTCRSDSVQSDPLEKKVVYDVFKYIDTEKSLEYSEPLLKEGFLKVNGEVPKQWNELIPDFDIKKIATAPLKNTLTAQKKEYENTLEIDDFESGEHDWHKAEYTTKIEVAERVRIAPKKAAFGEKCLTYKFSTTSFENGGFAEKGIMKKFSEPLDLSGYETFNFAVNVPGGLPQGGKHSVTVIFYGERINTCTVEIEQEKWNYIGVDLSGFAGEKKVDKIKIQYNSGCAEPFNTTVYLDGVGLYKKGAMPIKPPVEEPPVEPGNRSNFTWLWCVLAGVGCAALGFTVTLAVRIAKNKKRG